MIKNTLRYLTLALAFAGMSANAYADYNGQCNNDDACCDDSKFDLSAHVLIAKPCQDIGYLETNASGGLNETVHKFEYDWDWGVAIAGSFKFCDDWGFGVRYSYIQADTGENRHVIANTATASFGTHWLSGANSTLTAGPGTGLVNAKLETEMHTLDLLAQYECCLCGNFKFKPFGGVRIIQLENDMTIYINQDIATPATPWADSTTGHFNDQDLTAYGVVGGFDWEWSLCGDFYLIGSVSAAALSGDEDNIFKSVQATAVGPVVTQERLYNTNAKCKGMFAFDANVGVAWNTCLFGKGFDVQALYETRFLTGVSNPTKTLGGDDNYGVHGLRLGIGLSF